MIASSLSTNQLLAPLRTSRTLHHVLIADLYLRNLKTGHSTGFFSCCESGYKEGVELMLLYGADIEGTDTRTSRKDGSIPNSQLTALDLAAGNGHDQIVSLLLDHGARVSFQSKFPDRYSPLITAACVGFHKTTEVFLNHSAFANHEGNPEMAHAALCGLTGHCLHAGAHAKSTMNQSAVDYDATIGLLVKHGANINAPGPFGTVSPLHNIAIGLKPIQLRILAKWGGYVAIKDAGNNNTLFHWLAKRTGSVNLFDDIMCLLEGGVDFNAPNIHGQTPLHLAVQSFLFPRFELVWLLLKLGAIVDCRDTEGRTPFDLVLREASLWGTPVPDDLRKLLLEHGAFDKIETKTRRIQPTYTDDILMDISLLFTEEG